VVAEVVDGFTKGGGDLALLPFANVVRVLHSDGTFAEYVHLQAGIPVKEGERVKRGQVLPARDVTRHPRLRLVSMTPWNLTVTGPGAVSLRPMQDFSKEWGLRLDVAAVAVFSLNRAEREIGLGKVEFWLEDRKVDGPPP
jgi:hypothetical protein